MIEATLASEREHWASGGALAEADGDDGADDSAPLDDDSASRAAAAPSAEPPSAEASSGGEADVVLHDEWLRAAEAEVDDEFEKELAAVLPSVVRLSAAACCTPARSGLARCGLMLWLEGTGWMRLGCGQCMAPCRSHSGVADAQSCWSCSRMYASVTCLPCIAALDS